MFRLSKTISAEKEVVRKAIAAANCVSEEAIDALSQNELAEMVLKVKVKEHVQNTDFNRKLGVSPCLDVVYQNFRKANRGKNVRGFCFYGLAALHFPLPPLKDALALLRMPSERKAAIAALAKIGNIAEKKVVRLGPKKLTELVLSASIKYQILDQNFNSEMDISPSIATNFRKFLKSQRGQRGHLFYHYVKSLGFGLRPLSDFSPDIPRVSDKEALCKALAKAGGITEGELLSLSPLDLTRLVLSERIIKLIRSPEFNREIGVFPRPIELLRRFLDSGEGKNAYGQSLYGLAKLHFGLVPAEEALRERREREYAAERQTVLKVLAKIGNIPEEQVLRLSKYRLTKIVLSASIYRQINGKRFNRELCASPSMYTVYKKFFASHPKIVQGQAFYGIVKHYGFPLLAPTAATKCKSEFMPLSEREVLIKALARIGHVKEKSVRLLPPPELTQLVLCLSLSKHVKRVAFNRELGTRPRLDSICGKFIKCNPEIPREQVIYRFAESLGLNLLPLEEAAILKPELTRSSNAEILAKAIAKTYGMEAEGVKSLPSWKLTALVISPELKRNIRSIEFGTSLRTKPRLTSAYVIFLSESNRNGVKIPKSECTYEFARHAGLPLIPYMEALAITMGDAPQPSDAGAGRWPAADAPDCPGGRKTKPAGAEKGGMEAGVQVMPANEETAGAGVQPAKEETAGICPPAAKEGNWTDADGQSVIKVKIGEKSMLLPGCTRVLNDGMPPETISAEVSAAPIGTSFAFLLSRPPVELFKECVSAISGNGMKVFDHNSIEHTGQAEKEGPAMVLFEKNLQPEVSPAWFSNEHLVLQVSAMLERFFSFAQSAAKSGDSAALEGAKGSLADYAGEVKGMPFGNPVLANICDRSIESIAPLVAGKAGPLEKCSGTGQQLQQIVAESSQHLAMLKATRRQPTAPKCSPAPLRCRI